MRHHSLCKLWAKFHPYDCPECKVLAPIGENHYTEYDIDEIKEEARREGYEEAEDDMYWIREDEREQAYDDGFKDGKQNVIDNPEEYGLTEAA